MKKRKVNNLACLNIYISNNLNKVLGLDSPKEILSKINKEEGKFLSNKKVYYYSTITSNNTIAVRPRFAIG